jgi:starch phosphorylase
MHLYNQLKENPGMQFYPTTFIFGAKAAAGYKIAKLTIKLINTVADIINNDKYVNGKIKIVFIEDYRVSNAEIIFAAADVSEQISTASKEASGTGNMKFMLNGALTLGTMDGANVEIVEEVGEENAFIFGMSSDEVIKHERDGDYDPMKYFREDDDIRKVLTQLINGFYSPDNPDLFRPIYDSLLTAGHGRPADMYFVLKDFRSYAEAQQRVQQAYKDRENWVRMALLNVAHSGKFTSDRTIEEYVKEIWHLDKVVVDLSDEKPVEIKPIEATPVEATVEEATSVETMPVEATPVEARPVQVQTITVEPKRITEPILVVDSTLKKTPGMSDK